MILMKIKEVRNLFSVFLLLWRSFAMSNLITQKNCSVAVISPSAAGISFQKVVNIFAQALLERTSIEKGRTNIQRNSVDVEVLMNLQPSELAHEQELPFCQVTQFTGIQVILDSVSSAKKIHLVDFGIRTSSHWTMVMHALANRNNCSLELLKITAVGTSTNRLEETGQWLSSFAKSMNLPFSFKITLSEMKNVKKDMFELEGDEVVAVFSEMCLWSILSWPNHLESLIRVIKGLNPCVTVVTEVEANTNHLSCADEALVLFSGVFNCLETCLEQDNKFRKAAEEGHLREMIRNIVISKG